MNGNFIALSISSSGVRLAAIHRQNGSRHVRGLWQLEREQDAGSSLSTRLRELLEKNLPDLRKTLLVISSEDITYKDFHFPFSSSKKVMEAIQFETSADYPTSDYTIAPLETISGEPGKKSFLVAIVRRETLRSRIGEVEAAGLKVIGITADVSTLGHYFTDENESLVMEANRGQTLFALYSHQVPILVRQIPIGLKGIRNPGRDLEPDEIRPLVSEVKRTLLSFRAKTKLELDKIFLAGELLEDQRAVAALVHFKEFNFLSTAPPLLGFTVAGRQANLNAYASVLGSSGWRKKARFFDFMKDEFLGEGSAGTLATYARWGALSFICFVFVFLLSSWLDIFALQKRERFLAAETKRVFTSAFPQVTRIVDEVRQARNLLDTLRAESAGGNPLSSASVLDIMDRMSRVIPKEVSFQVGNLFWERGRLEIDGRTDSFKTVNVIQELLSKSSEFPEVTISNAKTRSDGQDVDFKITIRFPG